MKMSTKRNTRRQLKMESLEDRKLMTVMVEFAEMGVRDHLRSEIPSLWTSGGTTSVKVGHELGKLKMGGQEGEALAKNIAIEKVTDAIFADDNDVKDALQVNIGSEHWPEPYRVWTNGSATSVKVGHELGKLKMGGQEGEALANNIAIEKVTDAIFARENEGSLVNMASPHIPPWWYVSDSSGTRNEKVYESGALQLGGQEGEALAKNIAIEKVTDAIFAHENDGSLVNMASPHCPIDVLDIWTNGSATRVKDSMHQGAMNSVAGNNLQHGSDALHLRLSQNR
jgi:hypothetical protein